MKCRRCGSIDNNCLMNSLCNDCFNIENNKMSFYAYNCGVCKCSFSLGTTFKITTSDNSTVTDKHLDIFCPFCGDIIRDTE